MVGLGHLDRAVLLAAAQQRAKIGDGPLTATLVEAVATRLLTIDVEAPRPE